MKTAGVIAVVLLLSIGAGAQAPAPAPNPNQIFMGGLTALNPLNAASILYSGTGTVAPGAVTKYTVAINYGMGMSRVDVERAKSPKRTTQYFANDMAWDVVDGKKPKANPAAAAERARMIAMTPHGAMRYAFDPAGKRTMSTEPGPDGKPAAVATFQAAGTKLKAFFDSTSMITKVQTLRGDPVLGDTIVEFLFTDYKDVDTIKPPAVKPPGGGAYSGIPFPAHIVQKVGGQTVLDLTLTEVKPNAGLYVEVPEAIEKAMAKK